MKTVFTYIFTIALFAFVQCKNDSTTNAAIGSAAVVGDLTGKAVNIIDGDTFDLLLSDKTTRRIRLYGIDCPERGQPYYQAAKSFAGDQMKSHIVSVTIKDKDPYGRTVAIAYAGGININEALLRAGLTWHYTRYDHNSRWADLQSAARERQAGIWADPHPVAPWNWKRAKRTNH